MPYIYALQTQVCRDKLEKLGFTKFSDIVIDKLKGGGIDETLDKDLWVLRMPCFMNNCQNNFGDNDHQA